jgi:hypothetical protein
MAEFVPSPDFQEEIRRALAAPDPAPSFAKWLGERLAAQTSALPRRGRRLSSRTRLAWSLGVALVLLLAAFAIGPRNIVAAMQRLLGYIPGVGLVDDSAGLRVLAEPVTIQREGITVSVTQAVLDPQRTVLLFQADGIPPSARPAGEDSPGCSDSPRLLLPDGTLLQIIEGGGRGWGSGYENRMVFLAVPPEVDQVVFVLPCLMDTAPGAAPENWELPLRFVPAPPDVTVVPVLEVSPPLETSAGAEAPSQMGLVLERVIELQGAYILTGTFRQGDSLPEAMVMGISAWPEITDAGGQPIPFEPASDLDLHSYEIGVFPWAYQIPNGFAPPLTITLEAVEVQFPADLSFEFDTGPDPQPGQEWVLNQDLEVAGHTVTLVSAILHEPARENGYELFFRSDPDVSNVTIEDPAHMPVGGYGGGGLGEFSTGFIYEGSVPSGRLTFHISGLTARYPGPWTLTWSPPEGSAPVTPMALPQACLTIEGWQQATANPSPLPEGVHGRLIAYGRIIDDGDRLSPENAGVFVFNLASGQRQVLGPGTWPSLSRDGSRAAYGWDDGLHVVTLANGENQIVPGTTTNDYSPRWSPDGLQLAFVRVDDLNLYLVNLDGSGLRRLTDDPDYELLLDWSAEGSRLYYAVPGPDGLSLRSLELASGAVRDEFVVDGKGLSAAFSPDGRHIAFVGRVPGAMGYGLYLAQANGSDRRLIAQLDDWGLSDPVWSPDGQWLLVNIINNDVPDSEITPALINPETCQAIPLEGIEATVQDWAP